VRFAGVDPGKLGAIAFLDEAGRVLELIPTPMIAGGKHYDLPAIASIFRTRSDPSRPDRGLFVTVERLQPMPMRFAKKGGRATDEDANVGGVIANFNRGVAQGWAWMLAAYRIPHQLVLPQAWQRTMLAGMPGATTKEQSIGAAKRAWPSVDLRRTARSRNDDDAYSDALWLAEHGRRLHHGGPMFATAAARSGT
jgi:hypothetical protein